MANRTEYFKSYSRTENGWLSDVYKSQKCTSRRRGHKQPKYTKEELRLWVENQKHIFIKLMEEWADSDFSKWKKPSVDRLDDTKGYSLDNIRLCSWETNYKKQKAIESQPVAQYDKDGNFIASFDSYSEASKITGVTLSNVARCSKGIRKSAGGFVFKKLGVPNKVEHAVHS